MQLAPSVAEAAGDAGAQNRPGEFACALAQNDLGSLTGLGLHRLLQDFLVEHFFFHPLAVYLGHQEGDVLQAVFARGDRLDNPGTHIVIQLIIGIVLDLLALYNLLHRLHG
ncbi:hypothetical protein D3C81_1480870 [compost metagenome]